jgi:hypothetical protein
VHSKLQQLVDTSEVFTVIPAFRRPIYGESFYTAIVLLEDGLIMPETCRI